MNYFGSLLASKALPLMLPKDGEEKIHRFVEAHQSGQSDPERWPFRRQLDFWAFSIAYALTTGIEPLASTASLRKFIDTRAVQVPDELSEWLVVVAFSKIGHNDPEASDPGKIIDMCNRLAGAGAPEVIRHLQKNVLGTPLESMLSLAESHLSDLAPRAS